MPPITRRCRQERRNHTDIAQLDVSPTQSESSSFRLSATDIEKIIPPFEPGAKGAQSAKQWLLKVDNVVKLYDQKPLRALLIAITRLKGAAKEWYEGTEIKSYEHFKEELLKNFPDKMTAAEVHRYLAEAPSRPITDFLAYMKTIEDTIKEQEREGQHEASSSSDNKIPHRSPYRKFSEHRDHYRSDRTRGANARQAERSYKWKKGQKGRRHTA